MNSIAARILKRGLPLFALVLAGGVLVEVVIERGERNLLESRQSAGLDVAFNTLSTGLGAVTSDLGVVSSFGEIPSALDPAFPRAREQLAREFLAFARSKRTYRQVRLLGPDGRELVRVIFDDGRASIVPEGELEDTRGRPYFSETVALEPGAVYVSPLELDTEHGNLTSSWTPILRLATPVAGGRGARGVVVLDYLARNAFENLRKATEGAAETVFFVDSAGFFLRGRTPDEEWGRQIPGRSGMRLGAAFPKAWEIIRSRDSGSVWTSGGLFVFRSIRPASFVASKAGGAGGEGWKIVSFIPASEAVAVERRLLGVVAVAVGIVLLFMGAGLFIVAVRQAEVEETERRAADQLREAEARYRLLFERSQVGVYRSTLDGRLLECNDAFLQIFGFETREEALGRQTTSLYSDERDRARLVNQLLTEGKAVNEEVLLKQRDRSERWVLESTSLFRDADGSPSYMEGTLVDIDERRRAAEALRASEQRTRAILENMLGGLIMVDGEAVIEFVNPAAERMFGYSGAELLGQSLQVLVPVKPGVDVGVFMRQAAEKAMGRVTEWEGRRKNGEVFPFELALFQFDTPGGRRVAGSIVDLTARREVDRLKREFMSSISHELRTPLTSIRGSLGLLAGGVLGPLSAEAGEIVAVAERNAVRLIGLINDILDLERLEGGRLEMDFEAVETSPIVSRALEAVQSFAAQAEVSLVAEPFSVRVRADADRLVQVLVNLVSNAVKFSLAGGTVTVRVVPGPSMAEFQVEDRGRGVPPVLREAIFERYRQVEASDSRRKGGAGLGLAICKSIVEQHGGTIGVRDAEGAGSTFWFHIPLTSSARPSLSGTIKGARGLALLVDDDEELLSILELRLAQDRVATQRATTAREAIAAAHALKPDVLVLDLGLPDGDGSQVVEALRRDKTLRALPLLVYTGRDLSAGDRERLVLGPTRYLTKSRETGDEFRSIVLELLAHGPGGSA
jgi:PAS domain S-box-containing protein